MEMKSLLKLSGIKRFSKGQIIVSESDVTTEGMYIILIGTVGNFKNYQMLNETQTGTLEAGSFFGELNLFLNKPRSATAVALSDVVTLELNRANANELFMTQPDITFAIMEGLCRRLDAVTASYHSLHSEMNELDAIGLQVSGNSPIFPEGHGNYILHIDNHTPEVLYNEGLQCPMCGNKFTQLTVLESKLIQESRDPDQRVRFKDVEPIYYEIITCPQCLYSAMGDLFKNIEVTKRMIEALSNVMAPYMGSLDIRIGAARDTFTIFAGYYLAIMCAPVCFFEHQRITARLWRNLSRIYDDCSDEKMARYALQRAHDEYMFSYSNFDINGKSLQQLCYVIGELKYKLQDLDHARQFFYAAFTNKEGNPVVKRQAEDKLEEIKSVLKAAQR